MIRIGGVVIGRLDIAGGAFTYGNRLALGEIFTDGEASEYQRLKRAFRELYGYSCRLLPIRWRVRAFEEIVAGLSAWVEKERTMLHYDPTTDELKAGINDLIERAGALLTVKALAKAYGRDPDDILRWEYSKVFGILFTDLEEAKYERRHAKVLDDRYSKQHSGRA